MNLSGLLPLIKDLRAFRDLTAALRAQSTGTADVIESARAPMLAALSRALDAPMIVPTTSAVACGSRSDR